MDMDWEPEIPGHWSEPPRNHRQPVAAATTSSDTLAYTESSVTEDPLVDWEPEIPGQYNTPLRIRRKRAAAEAGFSETTLDTRSHSPHTVVQSFVPTSSYFAPFANILIYAVRIFHQICSATVQRVWTSGNASSVVAGSRQVIEIRKTTDNGFESVKRRTIDSGVTRSVAPTSQQIIRSKKLAAQPKTSRSPNHRSRSRRMAPLVAPQAGRASLPLDASTEQQMSSHNPQPRELPTAREALGVKLLASFTPRPIPGARGSLVKSHQPGPDLDMGQRPSQLSNIEPAVMEPRVQDRAPRKSLDVDRIDTMKPSLKGALAPGLRRSSGDNNKTSDYLEHRLSLPQLSAPEINRPVSRSNSDSETPKRVRFAMNNINGQPLEYRVKFYKDSRIGEWAPSSPWADDQVLACTSDLKSNLEALLRDDSWQLPPSTPVLNVAESYHSDEDPSSILEEDLESFIPGTDLLRELSDSSQMSIGTLDNSDQDMSETIDKRLIDESPIDRVLVVSPAMESPYARLKQIMKGSIQKLISSPLAAHSEVANVPDHSPPSPEPSLALSPMPRILEGSTTHTPGGDDYGLGGIDSTIVIEGSNGGQDSVVENSSKDATKRSNENYDTDGTHNQLQKEQDQVDAELSPALLMLKMSTKSKRKFATKAAARKLAAEAAAAKAKAEAEEAERKAWSHRRMPKEKLVKPLSKNWKIKIEEAMDKTNNGPLTTTIAGTELRHKDFLTVLGEQNWLNDEIINAYLEWIVDYANKKAGKNGRNAIPKVIAHNSFFYQNITDKGPNSVSRWMKRKKAEGKKLLEVETVLIPVNNLSHWTIIVVSPRARTIEYLDSFAGNPKVFVENTKAWLRAELGNAWREEEWRVLQTRSARQNNYYDCGVFCITNAECVAGGVDTLSYDEGDMIAQRKRIAGVLLNRGFGGDFIPAEDL